MSVIEAFLDDYGKVLVTVSKIFYNGSASGFYITDGYGLYAECVIRGVEEHEREVRYHLTIPADLPFGRNYYIHEEQGQCVVLQNRFIVRTAQFDKEFNYSGDDLGAIWTRNGTSFALWAPTAVRVFVRIEHGGVLRMVPMKRTDHGVFRAYVSGDLSQALYRYVLERDGKTAESLDPYGFSTSANGRNSAVINLARVLDIPDPGVKTPLASPADAVIYECSVRDMTSSILSNTREHGTFNALCQSGTSYRGQPTGFDYLCSLGITHVQLQPVIDFSTVDEEHPDRNYNWGYDPAQIVGLEGSYTKHPEDPYSRMMGLRKVTAAFHEHGIRVILDVVYNHMYDMEQSALNRTVPYYFFRYTDSGYLSNGSYCGNDLDSERPMMRKLLIYAVKFLMNTYGVDGFRFDLMGILDVSTMNQLNLAAHAIRSDALIYGEGWDMPTALSEDRKAKIYNQHQMPGIGHFNDTFRDVAKGPTSDDRKYDTGYLTGNTGLAFEMCSALTGNSLDQPYFMRFDSPIQSVNAVETHDNATAWDKMHFCCGEEPREIRLKRQKMMILATMCAQGIPFLHAGMEFCGTKKDCSNSYNAGDEINGMNWERMIFNEDLVEYTRKAISLRRSWKAFRLSTRAEVEQCVHFSIADESVIFYDIDIADEAHHSAGIRVILNPSSSDREYRFDEPWQIVFGADGECLSVYSNEVFLPAYTIFVCSRRH